MAKSPRTLAREKVVDAAEAAQGALANAGVHLAPIDLLRIAADYAARHAVLTTQTGTREAVQGLAEQLKKEFVSRVSYWEDFYFNGGEMVTLSTNPPISVRRIELLDMMLDPIPKKRGRPRQA